MPEHWRTIKQPSLDTLRLKEKLAQLRVAYKRTSDPLDKRVIELKARAFVSALKIAEQHEEKPLPV